MIHTSDCALHNGPAMIPESCSCGADPSMTPEKYGSEFPRGYRQAKNPDTALVQKLVDALYLAENACEFLCQFDEGNDDFPPITDVAIPAIKEALTEAEAWLKERK